MKKNLGLYYIISYLLCSVFPAMIPGIGYADELFSFMLGGVMIIYRTRFRKLYPFPNEVKIFFCFFIIYLLYSFIIKINVKPAILLDCIQQMKPFMAFYGAYYLGGYIKSSQKQKVKTICLLMPIMLVPYAIISIGFSEDTLAIFTGHSSGGGAMCLISACTYYYCSKQKKDDKIFFFILMSLGLLSLRSKFYGEYLVAVFLFFFVKKQIRFNIKYLLSIPLLLMVMVYFTWDKFNLYIMSAASGAGEGIGRTALYLKSFSVLRDYHWIGSGFGTYACFFSGQYYSRLYYDYGLYTIFGLSPNAWNYVADTYFPGVIGETGILGIILWIFFIKNIFKRINENYLLSKNITNYRLSILILITIMIESLAGPVILSNVGVPLMILFGIILSDKKAVL